MTFPIRASIVPIPYGPSVVGGVLKIDGNAGNIPPSFQFAVLSEDGELCQQGVSQLSDEQWAAWTVGNDASYILSCVASNEGFTLE